jgi:hypothetical protein
MAQAFDDNNNLMREAFGKDLKDAFDKIQTKIVPEDKVTKIVVKKLTLEERVEHLEKQVASLLMRGARLR